LLFNGLRVAGSRSSVNDLASSESPDRTIAQSP
jgi:hypothetical protein